jgi:peptidoglycan hydrolase-like protein with peptidoglycan-binding domain
MAVIPSNMDRDQVCGLQMALNEKTGCELKIDGAFGNQSIAALRAFQAKAGLPVTGNYDAPTQGNLGPFLQVKYLCSTDFIFAAAELNCAVAAVRAVADVEARAGAFIPDGRCTILFERHQFYKRIARKVSASELARLVVVNQDIISTAPGGYMSGAAEWERLNRAIAIDPQAAILSASWGQFQVMGFNYDTVGYASVELFVAAMKTSQRNHLKAFISFIKASPKLTAAIRTQNWLSFAETYNGPDHAKNNYVKKLTEAFAMHSTAKMVTAK